MVRHTPHLLCMLSIVVLGLGCAEETETAIPLTADDHGHDHHGHDHGHGHGHAETLGGAIESLSELRDGVSAAFAKGDADAAHGPLHDVGHLLEAVSKLAGASDLSDEAKAAVEKNVETLFDLFGAVDAKMHGDEEGGKDYKDVSEGIDAAIAAISEAAAPALGDHDHEEGHDDHGEDGHDHGEKDGDHADHHDDEEHEHADKDHDHEEGDDDHKHEEGKEAAEKDGDK